MVGEAVQPKTAENAVDAPDVVQPIPGSSIADTNWNPSYLQALGVTAEEFRELGFTDTPETVFNLLEGVVEPESEFEGDTQASLIAQIEAAQSRANLLGGVNRLGVDHEVLIGGADFSANVTSIDLTEEVGEDIEATIELDLALSAPNKAQRIIDAAELRDGSVVVLKLFDGLSWRTWQNMVVVEPSRSYGEEATASLQVRSKQINLQFREKGQKWEKVTDSQVVQTLAEYNGLKFNIEPTKVVHEEVTQANESVATFLNRVAARNGYEWRIESDNTLYFRKLRGNKTDIVMTYRPDDVSTGTILEAKWSKQVDSKKGKDNDVNTANVDVSAATVDEDTLQALDEGEIGVPLHTESKATTIVRPEKDQLSEDMRDGDEDEILKYVYKPSVDAFVPVRRGEVYGSEVARTPEEQQVIASGLAAMNKFNITLDIETYGQNDINIRDIIYVKGLAKHDSGKWFVTEIRRQYSVGEAYRMSIVSKAEDKGDGAEVNAIVANEARANEEGEPDSVWIFTNPEKRGPEAWTKVPREEAEATKKALAAKFPL